MRPWDVSSQAHATWGTCHRGVRNLELMHETRYVHDLALMHTSRGHTCNQAGARPWHAHSTWVHARLGVRMQLGARAHQAPARNQART